MAQVNFEFSEQIMHIVKVWIHNLAKIYAI